MLQGGDLADPREKDGRPVLDRVSEFREVVGEKMARQA
jgi:hypothetical protein